MTGASIAAGVLVCSICGDPIDRPRLAARRSLVWEIPREQGGTNTVVRPERLDEYAHPSCVKYRKPNSGQERLV